MIQQSKPIIPWMGGKRRLAKHILPIFPQHTCYAEPFAGGAALYFMKEPSKVEVINDLNGELVNLYRCVKHHLDELVRQFRWSLVSRAEFLINKKTDPTVLTDIQRAARFYYQQRNCFGGKIDSQVFGIATTSAPKFNLLRVEEDLSQAHLRLSRTYIEELSWQDCIKRYDREHTLFYCDPPYWQTAGYGVDFGWEQYEQLRATAESIKGKMIISINAHDDIKKLFNGFNMQEVGLNYSVGGKSRSKQKAKELIITNW